MNEPPVMQDPLPLPRLSAQRRFLWLLTVLAILGLITFVLILRHIGSVESEKKIVSTEIPPHTNTVSSQVNFPALPGPQPTWPVATERPEPWPQPGDFVGKWKGWWDGIYEVRFTISFEPGSSQWQALYEWEEQLSRPLHRMEFRPELVGDVLRIGSGMEITLSAAQTNRAVAVGNFTKKKRTAKLVRE